MATLERNGFTAELDVDPETTLLRGRIEQTDTVFHARYVHQLESRFRTIVDNGWFCDDMVSKAQH